MFVRLPVYKRSSFFSALLERGVHISEHEHHCAMFNLKIVRIFRYVVAVPVNQFVLCSPPDDPRIRVIPLVTKRPTLNEVKRVHQVGEAAHTSLHTLSQLLVC